MGLTIFSRSDKRAQNRLVLMVGILMAGALMILAAAGPAAAAPANDNFASAATLTGATGNLDANNVDSTGQAGEPVHASGDAADKTVWYSWTAPEDGNATFTIRNGSFDTILAVYTGSSLTSLSPTASNDNYGTSVFSKATFAAFGGTVYKIAIDGKGGATGTFSLQWSVNFPPNDNLPSPTVLSGNSGNLTAQTTIRSTGEPLEPSHGGATPDNSVWYSWTPSAGRRTMIDLPTVSAGFQDALAVYRPGAGGLTRVAESTAPDPVQAASFDAIAGAGYRIAVAGQSGSTGTFTLRWRMAPSAPSFTSAKAGNASASVSFGPPFDNGGAPISGYTVTSSPGGITASGTSSPINVTGLTNGTTYTFTVTATNAVGDSPPSAATNAVTPYPTSVSINDASVSEGNSGTTNLQFTITRSGDTSGTSDVAVRTANGSAVAPNDYTALSSTAHFAAGATTAAVTVGIKGELVGEPDETFHVLLSAPVNTTIDDGSGLGTIQNDGDSSLNISDRFANEGNSGTTPFTFTVTRVGATSNTARFRFSTANGTAVAGTDYQSRDATFEFRAGQQEMSIAVSVIGDTQSEDNETFFARLSSPVGVNLLDASGTGTIRSDDVPILKVNDVSDLEGNSGTKQFVFTVTRVGNLSNLSSVQAATQNGTATAPGDFTAVSTSVSFLAGQSSRTVAVLVKGDLTGEPNENFSLILSSASGAVIFDNRGLGNIRNDDPALAINDPSVSEGNSGTNALRFTVSRTGNTSGSASVRVTTQNGTAVAPGDFTHVDTTVNFVPNESAKLVTVPIRTDTIGEPNETFFAALSSPVGATIVDGTGTGTILNDGDSSFSIDNRSILEGNSGTRTMGFTVSRIGATSSPASFQYRTQDSAAKAGTDYNAIPITTVNMSSGQTSAPIDVTIRGDTLGEPHEIFGVLLSSPTGANFIKSSGTGTIVNDDPVLGVNDPSITEGSVSGSAKTMTFRVTRSGSTAGTATFKYQTVDGTATASNDYLAVPLTTATFASGESFKNIAVTVRQDTTGEPDETFTLRLSEATGATILDATGVGTILNDDPILRINDVGTSEGDSGTKLLTFTVTRSGNTGGTASFRYQTVDDTAVAPGDYVRIPQTTISMAAGETTKTIAVTINGDTSPEFVETFLVGLSNAVGATIVDGSGTGTIFDDD